MPEQWHAETAAAAAAAASSAAGASALGIGDRVLARTEERGQGLIAHPMKKLERSAELVLGVVKREGERFWLSPVDKRERRELSDRRPQGRRGRAIWCCAKSPGGRRGSARGSMRCSAIRSRRAASA